MDRRHPSFDSHTASHFRGARTFGTPVRPGRPNRAIGALLPFYMPPAGDSGGKHRSSVTTCRRGRCGLDSVAPSSASYRKIDA